MTANSDDIYIKADRNIEVAKKSVTLGDVLKIECVNPAMLARIRSEEQDGKGGAIHVAKIVMVVLISFFGAAFSTMAFNNDVGVTKMFGQIYELLTGTK